MENNKGIQVETKHSQLESTIKYKKAWCCWCFGIRERQRGWVWGNVTSLRKEEVKVGVQFKEVFV